MIDTHYDLLTICYVCYLKNDYSKIINISEEFRDNNVRGVFANLYFMSKEEMINELDINYYRDDVSILEMFKISKGILDEYIPNVEFIYSIEGCDYLKENELEELYKEGLSSIILVWNTESKYGSGNRSDKGLTKEGVSFLNKAIDLGIGIDLSHANENTFYDIIDLIKEKQMDGIDVTCYASHSNSRKVCDRSRNLTDEQLREIKSVNGLVGVLSNRNFVSLDKNLNSNEIRKEYLKHIIHISEIVGIDNVMVSTDDMRFCADVDADYGKLHIYDYARIGYDLKDTLSVCFNDEDVNKIMYGNVKEKVINKLNKKGDRDYDRYKINKRK